MPRSPSWIDRFWHTCRICLPAILIFLAGGLVTLSAFLNARGSETLRLEAQFIQFASERNGAVRRNLNTFADIVGSARLLHYKSGGMDRDDFRVLADPLLQHHPGIQALEWIPRVPHAQRARYERNARRAGHADFEFTEMRSGEPVRRSRQEEYFPVYFVRPVEGNQPAIGFDLASDPGRREALVKARTTGRAVATSRISLVQKAGNTYGILLVLPVFEKPVRDEGAEWIEPAADESEHPLLGYVVGVFNARQLIEVSLEGFSPEGVNVQWFDQTVDPPASLGVWNSEDKTYHRDMILTAPDPERFVEDLDFGLGERVWRVRTAATPAFFVSRRSHLPWVVLTGGLVFSLMVAIYLVRSNERTAKLLESESRYRTLVEYAPEAIVMLDPDHNRFVDANQNALDLFKLPRDELLAAGPLDLSPERQPDGTLSRDSAPRKIGAALDGTAPSFEWLHIDAEGKEIFCEVRLVRLASRRGKLLRGSITDITLRRRQEKERRNLEQRLEAARKLESLGLVAGGIAHDFNNLLTPILGRTDLTLAELGPDHPGRRHLEDIRVSAIRAGELIDQLLASTGQGPTVRARFSLNRVTLEMARLWEVSIPDNVELSLDTDPEDPWVEGDESQIRQLVLNLITNAADAVGGEAGAIRILTRDVELDRELLDTFEVTPGLPEGRYAFLEVTDTGPGIDPEIQVRIFDPFFTTKRTGRGLGLASLLGVVKSHGGGVKVVSEAGCGATFAVVLPRADAIPDGAGSDSPTERAARAPEPVPATGRVLVVDDEIGIRNLVCTILEKDGLNTLAVADGVQALDILAGEDGIRLALIDLSMPGPDGTEVFSEIRRLRPELPVVVMSGFGNRAVLEQLSAGGLTAYLQKPFDPEQLLATVHKALNPV